MGEAKARRRDALAALGRDTLDVLVVGGVINGVGITRDAAMRGLLVALVERGDLASGTSSRSSKLIHGGLRYLEQGDVRLVLEAVRERERLQRLAPHLVRPQEFVFPLYRGGLLGPLKLAAGLGLRPPRRLLERAPASHALSQGGCRGRAGAPARRTLRRGPVLGLPHRRRAPRARDRA